MESNIYGCEDNGDLRASQKMTKKLYEKAKLLAGQEKYKDALDVLDQIVKLDKNPKYAERRLKLLKFMKVLEKPDGDQESAQESELENQGEAETESGNKDLHRPRFETKGSVARSVLKQENALECKGKLSTNHSTEQSRSSGLVELCPGLKIPSSTFNKLYPYQRVGVSWLYGLYSKNRGGILADDMGLGKTIQAIVLIEALFEAQLIHSCLIIAPTTLLSNWRTEFDKWAREMNVFLYHGTSMKARRENLAYVQKHGGILMTTYGLASGRWEDLSTFRSCEYVWDYMILDEAHKVKNPIKTTKNLNAIPSRRRLGITGTPVQNNLKELWSLYDFVSRGTLLGSYTSYKIHFEIPIVKAREKGARTRVIHEGNIRAEELRKIYAPYFLRRTKDEVMAIRGLHDAPGATGKLELPPKIDWAVWIRLTELQCQMYREFISRPDLKALLMTKRSPLVELVMLKKLCDHPRLLSARLADRLIASKTGVLGAEELEAMMTEEDNQLTWEDATPAQLIAESGKLAFLVDLLNKLHAKGHRTLIFSQSLKMLDMIHKILIDREYKFSRLDGTVKIVDRAALVRQFQEDSSISFCLLTTQVGGVGLTLTAADSVVIYDPNWNPGTDSQAIDRAYRMGQKKVVFVYRLLTCGTVEEKIYRRQVFKRGLTEQTVEKADDPTRYFAPDQLRNLFKFDGSTTSETYEQLEQLHGHQRASDPMILDLLDVIRGLQHVSNVSEHDQLYSVANTDVSPEEAAAIEGEEVSRQVQYGVTRLREEAKLREEIYAKQRTYTHKYDIAIPHGAEVGVGARGSAPPPRRILPSAPTVQIDSDGEREVVSPLPSSSKSADEPEYSIYDPPSVPFNSAKEMRQSMNISLGQNKRTSFRVNQSSPNLSDEIDLTTPVASPTPPSSESDRDALGPQENQDSPQMEQLSQLWDHSMKTADSDSQDEMHVVEDGSSSIAVIQFDSDEEGTKAASKRKASVTSITHLSESHESKSQETSGFEDLNVVPSTSDRSKSKKSTSHLAPPASHYTDYNQRGSRSSNREKSRSPDLFSRSEKSPSPLSSDLDLSAMEENMAACLQSTRRASGLGEITCFNDIPSGGETDDDDTKSKRYLVEEEEEDNDSDRSLVLSDDSDHYSSSESKHSDMPEEKDEEEKARESLSQSMNQHLISEEEEETGERDTNESCQFLSTSHRTSLELSNEVPDYSSLLGISHQLNNPGLSSSGDSANYTSNKNHTSDASSQLNSSHSSTNLLHPLREIQNTRTEALSQTRKSSHMSRTDESHSMQNCDVSLHLNKPYSLSPEYPEEKEGQDESLACRNDSNDGYKLDETEIYFASRAQVTPSKQATEERGKQTKRLEEMKISTTPPSVGGVSVRKKAPPPRKYKGASLSESYAEAVLDQSMRSFKFSDTGDEEEEEDQSRSQCAMVVGDNQEDEQDKEGRSLNLHSGAGSSKSGGYKGHSSFSQVDMSIDAIEDDDDY